MKKYLITFILFISMFFILNTAYAANGYTIDKYDVDIKINEDNSLYITENIVANFTGLNKHGIIRNIPVSNTIKRLDGIEYKKRVKELGIFRRFRIETRDVKTFKIMWQDKGIAWFCEIADTEYIGNIEFKIINAYYGSSSFNSKQMSRLIDGVVQDCQAVGIETKPKAEIDSLLRSWNNEQKK